MRTMRTSRSRKTRTRTKGARPHLERRITLPEGRPGMFEAWLDLASRCGGYRVSDTRGGTVEEHSGLDQAALDRAYWRWVNSQRGVSG